MIGLLLASGTTVQAAPIRWAFDATRPDVFLTSGGMAITGGFTYDAVFNELSDVGIEVSGVSNVSGVAPYPDLSPFTFTLDTGRLFTTNAAGSYDDISFQFQGPELQMTLRLGRGSPLTAENDQIPIAPGLYDPTRHTSEFLTGGTLVISVCRTEDCADRFVPQGSDAAVGTLFQALPPEPQPAVFAAVAEEGEIRGVAPATVDAEGAIGRVGPVEGYVTIRRADGTVEPVQPGAPIFFGDEVETFTDASATLAFDDGSNFNVSEDARLEIDEYVYDDGAASSSEFESLQGLFVFTQDLIDGDTAPKIDKFAIEPPLCYYDGRINGCGSIGIRGDAEEIIRQDLEQNPDPTLGEVGLAMMTGSPVGVSTPVIVPEGPFDLSFEYAFIGEAGDFAVTLGGAELFATTFGAADSGLAASFFGSYEFMDWGFLTDLSFDLDGEAGQQIVLWNIMFDGTPLENLTLFAGRGPGSVEQVLIATPEQLDRLTSALGGGTGVTPVPAPAALPLMIGAVGALGLLRRRGRG